MQYTHGTSCCAFELMYNFNANIRALDLSAPKVNLNAYAWVQVTVIDDTDLTYRGKPLSLWLEEERRRYSGGGDQQVKQRRP